MKSISKNIVVILLFIFSVLAAKAQIFSGGIVGGVSTGAVKIENGSNKFTNVISGNSMFGYEVGVYGKLQLGPLYLKAMPLYSFNSGTVSYQTENNGESVNKTNGFSFQKFEIPVLLGLRIIGPLSIEAGPVYNYIFQYQNSFDANSINIQRNGIGYRAGAVLQLWRLALSLSCEGVTYNSSDINKATFKEPYKLVFGLAIKLGRMGEREEK